MPEMEDGQDVYYQLHKLVLYFGDFINVNEDDYYHAVSEGDHEKMANALFSGTFPLRNRNTGLLIKKMEQSDDAEIIITTTNNKSEEARHTFRPW
jgi:hypothetical protein